MVTIARAAGVALVMAGALALGGTASVAAAQRSTPRPAVGTNPHRGRGEPDHQRKDRDRDGRFDPLDPHFRPPGADRRDRRSGNTVIYLPADGVNGAVYPQPGVYYPQDGIYAAPGIYTPQGVYYPSGGGMGTLIDASGRPVAPGMAGGAGGGLAYTPDLSGSPYVVGDDGLMLVGLPGGERTFPSCASLSAARDPSGKPRTIFYQPRTYGLVLRAGQEGRVQGTPPKGTNACYGIDAVGRVALLY